MFIYVKDESSRLSGANENEGSDFDPKVMETYILTVIKCLNSKFLINLKIFLSVFQATAEAQEVIVARAIEMKHNDLLISSLAAHTANIFAKAGKKHHEITIQQMSIRQKILHFNRITKTQL